jgi:hypothetical protein
MSICLTIANNVSINNWLTRKVDQCLVHTAEYGKVFILHGSLSYQTNLQTLSSDRVKHILKDKDIKILTCHSLHYPKWVQDRCLVLTKDPINIAWMGEGTYFVY